MGRGAIVLAMLLSWLEVAQAGGLGLEWDCGAGGGVSNVALECANPDARRTLYGTFITEVAIPDLLAADFVIDLQSGSTELPGFWYMVPDGNPTAGCYNDIVADDEICKPLSPCRGAENPWHVASCGGTPTGQPLLIPHFGGQLNRSRILLTLRAHASPPRPVSAGALYFGFELSFFSVNATEAGGPCPGCTTPVVMVFNQATLRATDGSSVVIVGPGPVSNCVSTFGATTPCAATRARNRTWGMLKSLYR